MSTALQELKVSISENLKYLDWINEKTNKAISHVVAGSAATTRSETAPDVWSRTYSKKKGHTGQVNIFGRFGSSWSQARYKGGRFAVHFSFKQSNNKLRKEASLGSPLMNMYENDATIPVGHSNRKAPYVRPGTHIFARGIVTTAQMAVKKRLQEFEDDMNNAIRKGNK